MAQIDDLQNTFNVEVPRRPIVGDGLFESITVPIDPTSGVDPTDLFVVRNQASANVLGTIRTPDALFDRLPSRISYNVLLAYVAGDHTVTGFGDPSRFDFGVAENGFTNADSGAIVYTSQDGLERVPGTSTYAVASATNNTVTLSVDSGFSADEHRTAYLRVFSGTGSANKIKAIRSHTAGVAVFTIAGEWSTGLDATTVLEVVQPSVRLTHSSFLTNLRSDLSTHHLSNLFPNIIFDGLDILDAQMILSGAVAQAEGGTRFIRTLVALTEAYMHLGEVIFDGQGSITNAMSTTTGAAIRTRLSDDSWIIRDFTGDGISFIAPNGMAQSSVFLFYGAIDDCGGSGIFVRGPNAAVSLLSSHLTSSGNAAYGINAGEGTVIRAQTNGLSIGGFGGALGDVLLDGGPVLSWSELDALTDATRRIPVVGKENSQVVAV